MECLHKNMHKYMFYWKAYAYSDIYYILDNNLFFHK